MSKKTLILISCLVLSLTLGLGGSLAYLTDTDTEVNTFTMGNVDIELNEVFEQGSPLTPGVKIEKKPTIKNIGTNDAWVWATIAIPAALDNDDASKNVLHFNYYNDHVDNGEEWTWKDENGAWNVTSVTMDDIEYNVYTVLYESKLAPTKETAPVIHTVYMDANVDIDVDGNLSVIKDGVVTDIDWNIKEDGTPKIIVSAYAIQTEGFVNVQDAYAAYMSQWSENGEITEDMLTSGMGNWITEADTAWAEEEGPYAISSPAELAGLAKLVNSGRNFTGETITLASDINLAGKLWTPIGNSANAFKGIFNGDNKVISNMTVDNKDYSGLFGNADLGVVKNVTVKNAEITSTHFAGVIAGHGMCTTIENCHVNNAVITVVDYTGEDGDKVGGIVGYLSAEPNASVTNCTVTDVKIIANRDAGAVAGYATSANNVDSCTISNCTVTYSNYGTGANLDTDGDGVGRTK